MKRLGKPFFKNIQSRESKQKNVKLPRVIKNLLAREQTFVQIPILLYPKIRMSKFTAVHTLGNSLYFLFPCDNNKYFHLTSKLKRKRKQILKTTQPQEVWKLIELENNHHCLANTPLTLNN